MRAATSPLISLINALRSNKDATVIVADLFTIAIAGVSTPLTFTNADVPITFNGYTYLANSILIDGLKLKSDIGLQVDQQKITLSARPTDTYGGIPFLQAVRNGLLDGAAIQRERAFLTSWSSPPVGSVIMFKGRVGTIDTLGRTSAEITVNSDLVLLDLDMPRNLYGPNCQHVLYDSGCKLVKSAYGASGSVGSGSTTTVINWSGSVAAYSQGTISFSSGANTGATVTIKSATTGALTLSRALLQTPSTGDAFTAYKGCDHNMYTCNSRFGNLINFKGFPYVPPPTYAA